jgi:hypothetical protein
LSRPADSNESRPRCDARRRCRKWECAHCGPLRAGDEFRKFRDNLLYYGGRVMLVAITGPGDDVVGPRRDGLHDDSDAYRWNVTASPRFARMMKAAQVSADRVVRRHGWKGQMPRIVARAWAGQRRGIWHVHLALPAESDVERLWSRHVVRFMDNAQRRERAMPANERRVLLELERCLGGVSRGFYGWGFVDRKAAQRASGVQGQEGALRAARYMAENVARYMGENVSESAALVGRQLRSHVSPRLTTATGVTIRNLRRARWLFVVVREALPLPDWPQDELERVWSLLADPVAARGP